MKEIIVKSVLNNLRTIALPIYWKKMIPNNWVICKLRETQWRKISRFRTSIKVRNPASLHQNYPKDPETIAKI